MGTFTLKLCPVHTRPFGNEVNRGNRKKGLICSAGIQAREAVTFDFNESIASLNDL